MSVVIAAIVSPNWYWLLIIPVGVLVAFCALLFVVALVEKTPVTQFEERSIPPEEVANLPAYLLAMDYAAAQYGFEHGGTYRHVKYPRCYCSYGISSDRLVLARVAGGTIAKMPHKATALMSPLADGRMLVTRDEVTVSDLSGLQQIQVVYHADFDELWRTHVSRLQQHADDVREFDASASPRDIDRDWDHRQAQVMIERGLARWTDMTRTVYRHTLTGALRIVFVQYLGQFAKHGVTSTGRASRPRPGDTPIATGFPVQQVQQSMPTMPWDPSVPGASMPAPPPPLPRRPKASGGRS